MKKINLIFLAALIGLSGAICWAYSFDLPKVFMFNKKESLREWQEKVFKNKVLYTIEEKREGGYLLAESNNACSGLFYTTIKIDTKKFPMMSWYWKVVKFPEKSLAKAGAGPADANSEDAEKQGWIEKDDYAARVYVIFPSMNFAKTKSIEYIWDESLPAETIMTSPYFKNIKLIVVESGRKNLGKWVFEKRNVYEDYKHAFGKAPQANIGAIALMTDTDNTLSTAEALYRNIKAGYKNGEK